MSSMIVAPQPIAVEEGAKALMDGGNAVDAAVTCAFVQAVVSPHSCGIGGYIILTLGLAPGHHGYAKPGFQALDAPALAGSRVTPEMWEDVVIRPNPGGWGYFLRGKVNDIGYQSICVPGTVRGLSMMLERWGTISWPQAIAPAARVAEEGYVVDPHLSGGWKSKAAYPEACSPLDRILANPEASRIYLKDGAPYEPGEVLRNPDYARTLRHLAQRGPEDFYHGELSRRMSEDLAANGSFVTAEDLANYQTREPTPMVGTYREYTVFTSPPPHGGPTLLALLNILEGYDFAALEHNSPEYIYLVSMAMKVAFADRNLYLADAEFVDVPLDHITSKERAREWRGRIDDGQEIVVSFVPPESPDTTHVSVVDAEGNAMRRAMSGRGRGGGMGMMGGQGGAQSAPQETVNRVNMGWLEGSMMRDYAPMREVTWYVKLGEASQRTITVGIGSTRGGVHFMELELPRR